MKISKVINELAKYQKLYGDIECDISIDDIDGTSTGIIDINKIEETYNEKMEVESICIMHREE